MTPLCLTVGNRVILLERETALSTFDLNRIDQTGAIVARVEPHPTQPDVLGLKNFSDLSWTATMPDDEQRTIAPQRSVRLAAGTRIDFGGMVGRVTDRPPSFLQGRTAPPAAALKPVEKADIERLAEMLAFAAAKGHISPADFQALHADFLVVDAAKTLWTFGLKSRRWNRASGGQWTPGDPAAPLWMPAAAFQRLASVPSTAAPNAGGS
jgi:hypothetical protein